MVIFSEQYINYLKQGGLNQSTIKQYLYALANYENAHGAISDINQEKVNAYLAQSNTSIRRSLLRSVAAYKPTWFKGIALKKYKQAPRKLPIAIKEYELERLIPGVNEEYRLIIELMSVCGLRVSEAISIRAENVDFAQGVMSVMGKGNKERLCYPSPKLLNHLEALSMRIGLSGYLFPSPINEGKHIHPNTVRTHIKKVIAHAHPHMLRHYFATKIYSTTNDMRVTQDLLGHSNIATTSIYARVSNKKAAEAAKITWQ